MASAENKASSGSELKEVKRVVVICRSQTGKLEQKKLLVQKNMEIKKIRI